jgi:hypothetical protein
MYPIKNTTDTVRSASYLDIHLEIDNGELLKTKLYDKRDDFNFPIVNFRLSILSKYRIEPLDTSQQIQSTV